MDKVKQTEPYYKDSWRSIALMALALGILFAVTSSAWRIPKAGNLDEWYYIGYAHSYFQNPNFHTYYYKISRLPWILTQVVYRQVLGDEWANVAIVYSYLLSVFILSYLTARQFCRESISFLIAVVFTLLPANHGGGGWHYHTSLSGPLFLASLLMAGYAVTAVGSRKTLLSIGLGTVLATCIHSNIVFVNLLPCLGAWGLAIGARNGKAEVDYKKICRMIFLMITGAVLATAIFCIIQKISGRPYDFWRFQFQLATRFITDTSNQLQYWKPLSYEWIIRAPWLVFPFSVFIAALGWCATAIIQLESMFNTKILRFERGAVFLVTQYLATSMLWICWQIMGQTALDWSYFSYPLLFSAFICLVGMWGSFDREVDLSMTTRILLLLLIVVSFATAWPYSLLLKHLGTFSWIICSFLGAVLLALPSFLQRFSAWLAPLSLSLVVLLAVSANGMREFVIGEPLNLVKADLSNLVFQMSNCIGDKIMTRGGTVWIWFDDDEKLNCLDQSYKINDPSLLRLYNPAGSLNSLGLGGMPRPPRDAIEKISKENMEIQKFIDRKGVMIVVSNNPTNTSRLIEKMKEFGIHLTETRKERVKSKLFDQEISILEQD